jgi:hypothetical protein
LNNQGWEVAAVWAGVLISIAVNIYNSGMRSQRLKDVESSRDEHAVWLKSHDARLNDVDLELAENRGFRKGFEAAKVKDKNQA